MQNDITLKFYRRHHSVVEALKNWGPEDLYLIALKAGYNSSNSSPCTWTIPAARWPEVDRAMGKQFAALKRLGSVYVAAVMEDTIRRESRHLIDAWCMWSEELNGDPLSFPPWSEPAADEAEVSFP